MSSEADTNIPLIKQLFHRFAARDSEGVRELLSPDIEWIQMEGFPGGGRFVGVDAVFEGVFGRLRDMWEGWKAVPTEYRDAGDAVLVLGHYDGTWPATGRSFRAGFAHLYSVREGRIVRFQQFTDTALIAEAMGLSRRA
jgi:ketosteroid isomerase-like protein